MTAIDSWTYEKNFYRMTPKEKRYTTRAALKSWRESHPEYRDSRPIHHGWFGWVLVSTAGEQQIVANVLQDCIIPYLRARAV